MLERVCDFFTGLDELRNTDVRPALDAQIDITKAKLRDALESLVKRLLREAERGTGDVQHGRLGTPFTKDFS